MILLIRGKNKYDHRDREIQERWRNTNIYPIRGRHSKKGRYKMKLKGSYKEFCNLFRRWKLLIEGEISIQAIIFFLVLSYYFILVSLVKQSVFHLVDQFGLPSMKKRDIIEDKLRTIRKGDFLREIIENIQV